MRDGRETSLSLDEVSRVPLYVSVSILLVVEVVWLSVRFDTGILATETSFWAQLLGRAPQYFRFALTTLAVTLLFGDAALWNELQNGYSRASRPAQPYLLTGHFASILAFAWITGRLLDGGFSALQSPSVWVVLWFTTGGVAFILLGLVAMPAAFWFSAIKRARGALLCGVAISTLIAASGLLTRALWNPLAAFTYGLVSRILGLFYTNVVSDPSRLVVGTPNFKVLISPECSGYEGIGLVLAFLGFYIWHFRHDLRFPHVLILLPIGVVSIWVLNLVRIVGLIAIGAAGATEIARGGFHSQAGWIAFNAVSLGLVAIAMRSDYFTLAPRRESVAPDATGAYLAPFLAVIATAMLTGALSGQFDWLYPLRVVAAAAALWVFRGTFVLMKWKLSVTAIPFGVVAFLLWLALAPEGTTTANTWPEPLLAAPFGVAAAWFLIKVVGYVITVPIVEELAFRGYLTRRLMRADFEQVPMGTFAWPSFLISSLLFGAMHGQFWVAGTVTAMVFAAALYWRRSLADAVQAHSITNLLIVLYVLTTGKWSLWS